MLFGALARGELPADVDVREFVGLVAAPIYYRKLVTGEPLDRAVATALAAVRAGLCRRQPRRQPR
ncbi:TetR-like C-terminal domain-containing protein [Mycobacterium sp. 050134]|uniref:TetR-like C-terminal domain-containing protein n=1 Tax=Mycobacterium sp. 050134 TaxID=3096111 RepID=UPI002ED85CDE